MSTALAFQSTTFDVIDRDGQPWIQSGQLASALGYKDEGSVRKIYARNSDEFTPAMSVTVNLTRTGGIPTETRIFSLRGCHLLAMFARTSVSKAFRVWVLDVLETLNRAEQRPVIEARLSTVADTERKALAKLVKVWAAILGGHPGETIPRCNVQVAARFGKTTVDEMTVEQVRSAIAWVQGKIDGLQNALPKAAPEQLALPPAPRLSARDVAIRAEFLRCYDEYRQNWDEGEPFRRAVAVAANRVSREHGDPLASNAVYALQELLFIQDMIGNGVYHAMSVARAVVG